MVNRKTCFVCGTTKGLTKHHIVPRNFGSFGGFDAWWNIIRLCEKDHVAYHKMFDNGTYEPTLENLLKQLSRMRIKHLRKKEEQ